VALRPSLARSLPFRLLLTNRLIGFPAQVNGRIEIVCLSNQLAPFVQPERQERLLRSRAPHPAGLPQPSLSGRPWLPVHGSGARPGLSGHRLRLRRVALIVGKNEVASTGMDVDRLPQLTVSRFRRLLIP
jgi:hypothetical protein